jgi:hypothetical protein
MLDFTQVSFGFFNELLTYSNSVAPYWAIKICFLLDEGKQSFQI